MKDKKLYGQEYVVKQSEYASSVRLKIEGKWVDAELRDLSHNLIPLPHQIEPGERYLIVATEKVYPIQPNSY